MLKFPVNDIRKTIDDTWVQLLTTESISVPSGSPYVVELYEVPDDGTVNDRPSINGLLETNTYPPSAGEFYVNYDTGHIAFHDSSSNTSYDVDYWKKGTLVEAVEINYLYDRINTIDSMYTVSSLPPSGNIPGSQWFNTTNSIVYSYDPIRSKWLSIDKVSHTLGKNGLTNKMYLSYYGGVMRSNTSGIRIPRDGCITSLSGQFSNLGTGTFYIRKNSSTVPIATLDIINDYGGGDILINTDIDGGDVIRCYFESPSTVIQDPMVSLEISWR